MSGASPSATLLRAAVDVDGPVPEEREQWTAWAAFARQERVTPLFCELVRRAAHVPQQIRDDADRAQVEVAAVSVRLERSLLQVVDQLTRAGVPFAVLKGVATAHLDYPDPGLRQFGDVDVLVAPERMAEARRALESGGWRQAYPLPRHHDAFTHAVTFGGVGIAEIDLHQRIGHRAIGLRVPTVELLEARTPLLLADHQLWALSDIDRLIHACIHAVASRGQYRRLSSVADVLVLSRGAAGRDPRAVLARAEGWRVRPLIQAGVVLAYDEAELEVPGVWVDAAELPVRRRDRLLERAYLGDRRRPVVEEVAHLRAMGRWTDRALYLYGHLRMDTGPGAGGARNRLRYLRSRLQDR